MKRIYLDNNATTGLDPRVLQAMLQDLSDQPANPSSIHFYGQEARKRLYRARESIAQILNVTPNELIFTSGGTESLNMLIQGFYTLNPLQHIVTSNVEHSCVLNTLQALEKKGARVTYLPAGLWGNVQLFQIENLDPDIMIFSSVNNETGVKLDIEAIAYFAEKRRIPLIIDGVCHLGKEPFIIHKGVTAAAFSGHKLHAPKGIGLTFLRKKTPLNPLIYGGNQEHAKRAGTENLAGIVGLAKAIELLPLELPAASERMKTLISHLHTNLKQMLPDLNINGQGPIVCNTANIAFTTLDAESLLFQLDQKGVAVSHGSACSSGALEPSRILLNMGLSQEIARSSLRFSLSRWTTLEEIDTTCNIIRTLITRP
jgi:cysteine desulfurase